MPNKRTPHEVKEMGIKKMKDAYEKNTRRACSSEQLRKFEKMYEQRVLPEAFDKNKGK